ncbi:bifunctional DNA primase/polymerase [Allorhizobium undicola]|uniref:bifunctional DNA primase/polymerase n=1 Tax=Allorhizobium undicola TaxID=78527 RepID=UPI00068610DC|nr:bifunctional DNA primase/polymerase [Allorhizobium undicola]
MSPLETKSGRAAVIDAPASEHLERDGAEFKRNVDSKNAVPLAATTPLILDLIPLHAPNDVDGKGRSVGKAPLHSGWRREMPLTGTEAAAHLASGKNLGARLKADQLVIDADPRNYPAGDNPLARLIADMGLPDAPTVETGGGGFHIYMRKPEGLRVRGALEEYPGIEFKTLGRQVVVPPSVHPNGRRYEWDPLFGSDMTVPIVPDALLSRLRRPPTASVAVDGAMTSEQLSKLLDGLDARDFGSNDLWLPIAMACHHATGGDGIDAFLDWCATDPDYSDRLNTARARWESFGRDRPASVTRRTLYKALHEAGRGDLVEEAERSDPLDDFPLDDIDELLANVGKADLVERMNERFCAVLNGGRFLIYMEDEDDVFDPPRRVWTKLSRESFLHFHEDERVQVNGGKRALSVAEVWLASPRRRKYSGIVMDPERRRGGDKLNLWRGWSVTPKAGDWSLMRELIERVLCCGERAYFEYVLRWIAFMFQHPGTSPEAAIAFRGKEGTGKSTLGRALMAISGAHGLTVSSPAQFAGRFNSHLRNVAFLFADEAFWPGNKEAEGVLKQLVTEPVIAYEGKGADIVSGRNLVHLMMASNNEWIVPAGLDARRFAVFDVSDERRNDKAFFAALNNQMANGGHAAMLHDLLALDLTGWHPSRGIPQTQALAEQKALSLDPAAKWWMEVLDRGVLPLADKAAFRWEEGTVKLDQAARAELVEDYDRFLKANRVYSAKASHKTLVTTGKALGLETVRTKGGKDRAWVLPPLDESRRLFEERLGAGKLFE